MMEYITLQNFANALESVLPVNWQETLLKSGALKLQPIDISRPNYLPGTESFSGKREVNLQHTGAPYGATNLALTIIDNNTRTVLSDNPAQRETFFYRSISIVEFNSRGVEELAFTSKQLTVAINQPLKPELVDRKAWLKSLQSLTANLEESKRNLNNEQWIFTQVRLTF